MIPMQYLSPDYNLGRQTDYVNVTLPGTSFTMTVVFKEKKWRHILIPYSLIENKNLLDCKKTFNLKKLDSDKEKENSV